MRDSEKSHLSRRSIVAIICALVTLELPTSVAVCERLPTVAKPNPAVYAKSESFEF